MGSFITGMGYSILMSRFFDPFILLIVLLNCILLALIDPTKPDDEQKNYIKIGEIVFSVIYIIEMLLKVSILGVNGYFRDCWNWLDFVVGLEAIASIVLQWVAGAEIANISALRVLWPLRLANFLPVVKLLFLSFAGSISIFGTLLLSIAFFVLACGNFAWSYWAEELQFTCVDDIGQPLDQFNVLVCDNGSGRGFQCPSGFTCQKDWGGTHHPHSRLLSYNTIYYSMLQVFQAVSLEGWQPVLWATADGVGLAQTTVFYACCIFIGNILLVLLFPAAYSNQLQLAIENSEGASKQEEEQLERNRLLKPSKTSPSSHPNGSRNRCLSELEVLLRNNSQYEVEELEKIRYMEAVRRGEVKEREPEDQPIPAMSPFSNRICFVVRKAILNELGPFNLFIYCAICLNAFLMSTWHAGQPQAMTIFLNGAYLSFTVLFVAEVAVRLFFLGPIAYFTNLLNVFDFAVTTCAVAEVSLGSIGGVLVFRIVRLFLIPRAFRLASLGRTTVYRPSWQMDLPRMLNLLLRASLWVVYIYMVLILSIYIFSVLGMQFFGNSDLSQADRNTNDLSFNYSSFGKSTITVLNLLTGSYWSQIMYSTVDAVGIASIVYYILWLVLSRWVMLAAVVSILFYQVDRDGEEHLRVMARASVRSVYALDHAFKQTCRNMLYIMWRQKYYDIQHISKEKGRVQVLPSPHRDAPPKSALLKLMDSDRALFVFEANSLPRQLMAWVVTDFSGIFSCSNERSSYNGEALKRHRPTRLSWLLENSSLQRRVSGCYHILILLVVLLSAVFIAISSEIHTGNLDVIEWDSTKQQMELFITVVFCLDVIMKSIAHGFVFHRGAYLTSQLNRIDFVVTVSYIISLAVVNNMQEANNKSNLSALFLVIQLLRVFDFIRLAPMSKSFMNVLESVKTAQRAIIISICITFCFWYMWSVVGLRIWAGAFNYCNDAEQANENGSNYYRTYENYLPRVKNEEECIAQGLQWIRPRNTFDNFGDSLWSVFIIFTMDFWHPILFNTITASQSPGGNSIFWGSLAGFLYFLFSILCFFILIYLFISVIYSTFTYINNTHGGKCLLSLKQAFWAQYYNKLIYIEPHMEPERPEKGIRRTVYAQLTSVRFKRAFIGFIVFNLCVRFLYAGTFATYNEAPYWIHFQEIVCSFMFVLEWILRAVAFGGVRAVMQTVYQFLDSITTLVMVMVFINEVFSMDWVFISAISVVRVIRLGAYVKKISELAYVISKSLSVITSLLICFFLLMFVWAIVGMLAFRSDTFSNIFGLGEEYEMANRYTRFDIVPLSMLTLLGVATSPGSNGWTSVMLAFTRAAPDGWSWIVSLFFISYAFLCNFLIWNLFMMVLVYSYKVYSADKAGIAMEQVEQFRNAWKAYSFKETGNYRTILGWQLPAFLQELPIPLGVGKNSCYLEAQSLTKRLLVVISEENKEWSDVRDQMPWKMRDYLRWSKSKSHVHNRSHSLDSIGGALLHLLPWHSHFLRALCGQGFGAGTILSRRPGSSFLPPGERTLEFSSVLVALHKVLILGEKGGSIDIDREVSAIRHKARDLLSILELGARNFIENLKKNKKRCSKVGGDGNQFDSLHSVSLLRRQAPELFAWYCVKALTIEFTRWREEIDISGHNASTHLEGPVLASCIRNEVEMENQQIRVFQRFLEKKGADHHLVSQRLEELKAFIKELHLLLSRVTILHSDSVELLWEPKSLSVAQVIEPPTHADSPTGGGKDSKLGGGSVSGICMSADATWVMCCTTSGKLNIYLRRRSQQQIDKGRGSSSQIDAYVLNQSMQIRSKDEANSSSALCVACSDSGQHVLVGCDDHMVRIFSCLIGRSKSPPQSSTDRNRKRQRALFKPDIICCGHKASVLCVHWLTSATTVGRRFWISGGADGLVCLWRFRSTHPVQQIKVGTSFIGRLSISCLKVWTCSLSINMLAACVEASNGRDTPVQARSFVLVGDSSGYLHVLPLQYDTQFLTGSWKSQLKVRAYPGGSSVTAVNVAEDRIYTAGGSIGTIKVWQPIFANERRQEVEQLVLVGQQNIHAAPVTCVGFVGGLLHTASDDMSIVTWHPSTQDKGMDMSNISNCDVKPVTHITEPGFIAHCGEICGMVTHKCQIITVDKYGRLVVRIPTSLNERRLFRQVPSNEAITALLPTARKLLRDQRECLGGSGVAIQSDLASGPNAPILRFLRRAAVRCKGQAAGHTKKVTHEQLRSQSFWGFQMDGHGRKGSNQTIASRPTSFYNSGLIAVNPDDKVVPWAHSCTELQKIKHPSRFLAAVMCFYIPAQTIKGTTMFDPPVPSSPFSSACKTDCNSHKGEKKGEYSKEEEHLFCIKKTENKTLTICWDGMFVTIPYEHQQTIREVTSVATGVYKNELNIDSSEKWGAKSKLSTSTRSFDELSPEMLVRDVVEQSGIRMLYLIQGAGEGNKVEENNCNNNSSNSSTHDSVIPAITVEPSSFPSTTVGMLNFATSSGVANDRDYNTMTAVGQDSNATAPKVMAAGGLLAQILGLVHESGTTSSSEEYNSEFELSESDN